MGSDIGVRAMMLRFGQLRRGGRTGRPIECSEAYGVRGDRESEVAQQFHVQPTKAAVGWTCCYFFLRFAAFFFGAALFFLAAAFFLGGLLRAGRFFTPDAFLVEGLRAAALFFLGAAFFFEAAFFFTATIPPLLLTAS